MDVSDNIVTGLMAHQAGRKAGYHLPPPALTQLKRPVVSSTARAQDQLTLSFKAGITGVLLAVCTAHITARDTPSTGQDLPFILDESHQVPWQPTPAC